MNLEGYLVCGIVVLFNVYMFFAYRSKAKKVSKFYAQLQKKNTTELDLELATTDQLIKALVTRPGYPLVLITPKSEKQLEVHVRNVTAMGVCSLLATAQLVILNQQPVENTEDEGE